MPEPSPLTLPANVRIGPDSVLTGSETFRRFFAKRDPAVEIGSHCHLEDVQLALGPNAHVRVGDHVFASHMLVLCEEAISIGDRVFFSFNVVLADTDFHPLDPALRVADAIAISPVAQGRKRPPIATAPLRIDDDVWIGPNVTILKGVHVGAGAFIEPGALVTRDVPPRARMLGNPAQIVGEV